MTELFPKVMEDIWTEKLIKTDYDEGFLLREDSLKCALYYHLRSRLSLDYPDIRVFAEFPGFGPAGSKRQRPDLVVARLKPEPERAALSFKESIKELLAIFEIKYVGKRNHERDYLADCAKLQAYGGYSECGTNTARIGVFLFEHAYGKKPDWCEDIEGVRTFVAYLDESNELYQEN